MTIIPLPQELIDSQIELGTLREEYKVVHDKLMLVANKNREIFSKFAMDAFESAEDKLAHILSPQFYDVSVEHLRITNTYLRETYNTETSGHNSLTYQRLPQLTFIKGNDSHNQKLRQLIKDVLPHMIPFSGDMKGHYGDKVNPEVIGFCLFGILDYGLSEYASINVYFSHDEKVLVSSTRYSRTTYSPVMDLDEGIDYLIKNHYYESLDPSDTEQMDD